MELPISWTDLTSDTRNRPVPLEQLGGDVYCVFHHAYNYLVQDTIALFKPEGKQVTATVAIGPTSPRSGDYHMVRTLLDNQDPYTTSSFIDRKALTAEISNLDLAFPYPVASKGKELFAQLIAYAHVKYGMPIDDYHVLSHQEAYARGWGSYATACPGPDLQGAKQWMIDRAKQIVAGGGTQGDNDMTVMIQINPGDKSTPYAGQVVTFSRGSATPQVSKTVGGVESNGDSARALKLIEGFTPSQYDGDGWYVLNYTNDSRGSFKAVVRNYLGNDVSADELMAWFAANPGKTYVAPWLKAASSGGGSGGASASADEIASLVESKLRDEFAQLLTAITSADDETIKRLKEQWAK